MNRVCFFLPKAARCFPSLPHLGPQSCRSVGTFFGGEVQGPRNRTSTVLGGAEERSMSLDLYRKVQAHSELPWFHMENFKTKIETYWNWHKWGPTKTCWADSHLPKNGDSTWSARRSWRMTRWWNETSPCWSCCHNVSGERCELTGLQNRNQKQHDLIWPYHI